MAGHDIFNDVTPKQTLMVERRPSIADYKAAIAASPQAAFYDVQKLFPQDLRAICRTHNIPVLVRPEPEA